MRPRHAGVAGAARATCVALAVTWFAAPTGAEAGPRKPPSASASSSGPKTRAKKTRTKKKSGGGQKRRKRRSSRRRQSYAARAKASRGWHTPDPGRAVPKDAAGRPKLALFSLNLRERIEAQAATNTGGFAARDLDRMAHVLRDSRTGNEHPVDPRLLDLVYRIQVAFSAQEVRVISGYRTPRRRGHSNHGRGRALDVVIPGAKDEDVARFVRKQGFVGVGVYPRSGFVHVDLRPHSFFWVDRSGPGRRGRVRQVLGKEASANDAQARKEGKTPIDPFAIGHDVDASLRKTHVTAAAPGHAAEADADDDDSHELPAEP